MSVYHIKITSALFNGIVMYDANESMDEEIFYATQR